MTDENKTGGIEVQPMIDSLKTWVMIALTFLFVMLYAAALFGMIAPLKDVSMINRLEPILFVIIGYYFGRLPAQANENTLKTELYRQNQIADAARQIKEKAQRDCEVLEEKIKNAKIVLTPKAENSLSEKTAGQEISSKKTEFSPEAIETAIKILDS